MGDVLYQRKVRVTIASPVKESFKTISADVVTVENLRVQFKIEKSLGKEPNTAEVTITNLSPTRRAQLQQFKGKFILEAGYASGISQLFVGDIRLVDHVRDGANWNTKITSGDGERAFMYARVNESFKGGTGLPDIVTKIAGAMGLDLGNLTNKIAGNATQYVQGYTAFGPAARELDKVLTGAGFSWSIQDGALQVLKSDKDSTILLVPDLSPDTGLIGSPEFGASDKNKGPVIKAKSLLQPRIVPGGRVKLTSERYKGEVRVTKVSHEGDTNGGPWYTPFEGEPL